jgi:hypothetical protein
MDGKNEFYNHEAIKRTMEGIADNESSHTTPFVEANGTNGALLGRNYQATK